MSVQADLDGGERQSHDELVTKKWHCESSNICSLSLKLDDIHQQSNTHLAKEAGPLGPLANAALQAPDLPFQPELLVRAVVNGSAILDALVDSGCQITAISSAFAQLLHLELKPSDVCIGLADSRRVPVAGSARVVIHLPGARPIEMSVLVFDGLLYSMLLGLDYLVATDASVRPAQFRVCGGARINPRIALGLNVHGRCPTIKWRF